MIEDFRVDSFLKPCINKMDYLDPSVLSQTWLHPMHLPGRKMKIFQDLLQIYMQLDAGVSIFDAEPKYTL